jgi:mevalonate kinase
MTYELKDYLKAINETKEPLMDTDDEMWEKKYPAFIVNKCLAPFPDTIFLVNEMNINHHLDKKLQFDFLLNSLRTRKRYTPWLKASKQKDIEYVKEYYGYNNEKAKSALKILSDEQIKTIKNSLNKGGRNGKH